MWTECPAFVTITKRYLTRLIIVLMVTTVVTRILRTGRLMVLTVILIAILYLHGLSYEELSQTTIPSLIFRHCFRLGYL